MALKVGSWLGHYEVTTLMAQGGLGEVDRVRDNPLKRDVAPKLLLAPLTQRDATPRTR